MHKVIIELHFKQQQAPIFYCDNVSEVYLAHNPVLHLKVKHVEIDFHFIREKVKKGELKVEFIPSQEQVSNVLTIPLPT